MSNTEVGGKPCPRPSFVQLVPPSLLCHKALSLPAYNSSGFRGSIAIALNGLRGSASSPVTLLPGDVIGVEASGGVGMGTSVRGSQLWLVAGDDITATIHKIGTLRHKVEAAPAPAPSTDCI